MINRKLTATFVIYWLPVLCYMGVIFFLSSLPSHQLIITQKVSSYFLHMVEYFFLCILLIRGLNKGFQKDVPKWSYVVAIIISSCYGVSDEIHQRFVPTRQADMIDVAADVVGAFLAVGIVYILIYWKNKRISPKGPKD